MELRDRFTDMREMDLQVQSKFDVVCIFCMSNIMIYEFNECMK